MWGYQIVKLPVGKFKYVYIDINEMRFHYTKEIIFEILSLFFPLQVIKTREQFNSL